MGEVRGGRHVVVIGAGITGLAAAFEHRRRHPVDRVTVFDGAARAGGKLAAVPFSGHEYDIGAEMVLARVPEALDLIRALGLGDQLVNPVTTTASIRYAGVHHPIPASTVLGVPTSVEDLEPSGLFSPAALDLMRAEPDAPGAPLHDDVAVGLFLRARLGDELVDRLVEPLLGGVYAGRADQLSLRATMPALAAVLETEPSVLRAAAQIRRDPAAGPVFATLTGGLAQVISALVLQSGARIRLGTAVREIHRRPSGAGFILVCGAIPVTEWVEADAVVVAAPPPKAAKLLAALVPIAARELAGIPMASMAVTALAWPAQPTPPGSGLLVPPVAGGLVKAVTVSSNKWPHLAGGAVLARASVGRIGEEHLLQVPDETLLAAVAGEVAEFLDLDGAPTEAAVQRWGGGLPQYAVGHLDRVARIRAAVAEVPGLFVAGAAYDGVGVPACIRSAYAALDLLG